MKGANSVIKFPFNHLGHLPTMMKKEQILPTICFILCCISIFFTLIDTRLARECFFIASYLSIIGMIVDRKNLLSYCKIIPLALLTLGVMKVAWFIAVYYHSPEIDFNSSSLQAGKRLILATLIITYMINKKDDIFSRDILLFTSLSSTFIITSIIGLYQVYQGMNRIEFINTRATDAAYIYSCISVALILLILKNESIIRYIISVFIFSFSLYLTIQTGTRISIIMLPVIFATTVFFNSRFKHKKHIIISSIMLLLGLFWAVKGNIESKIEQTKNEFLIYKHSNGNESTSLGTRLAMWQVGFAVFKQHPWGMSLEQRYQYMSDYVHSTGNNESALTYANIHLHNESIETATQQGIFGVLILWLFYITILFKALSTKNSMLLMVILFLMAYGLTDVILISREQTIYFSLMLLMAHFQISKNQAR